jgi:biotin---protein ligase
LVLNTTTIYVFSLNFTYFFIKIVEKRKILMITCMLYNGTSSNVQSLAAIKTEVETILQDNVHFFSCSAAFIRDAPWHKSVNIFIMGAGVCSTWEEELGQVGMQKIRDFVTQGGRFLGICAGAYFGSALSIFKITGAEPIIKMRPLKFYEGAALGPLLQDSDYLSPQAARATRIDLLVQDTAFSGLCYYQGGCCFDASALSERTKILATYKDIDQIAVLSCKVETGCAVLCGVHPEFLWTKEQIDTPAIGALARQLEPYEPFRKLLWKVMITNLLE